MVYTNPFLIPDANSPVDRSFVDLSIDGVAMSELGLVVCFDNTFQTEPLSANFTNNITDISGRNGSIFWGTDINNLAITRKLSTDGMTARQYNRLKQLIAPGKIVELILAQRPYCYIRAVLESNAEFSFVPFPHEVYLGNEVYYDTLYKGETTLTWTLLDQAWRGEVADTSDYVKQPWLFESGVLPLRKLGQSTAALANPNARYMVDLTNSSIRFPNSAQTIYVASNSPRTVPLTINPQNIYLFNAGNAPAHSSIALHFAAGMVTASEALNVNWSGVEIYKNNQLATTIGKPRAFADLEYTASVLNSQPSMTDANFEQYKPAILKQLRENLDGESQWRNQILFMVNATMSAGSAGGSYTLTTLKSTLRQLFNACSYTFTLDGFNRQMLMDMVIPRELNGAPVPWYNAQAANEPVHSVENIEGISNGKYITIDGNTSITSDFNITPMQLTIRAGNRPGSAEIYFLNEYV